MTHTMPATREWVDAKRAKAMLERDLAAEIQDRCKKFGLLRYHTFDSRRSAGGWPDEVILSPRTGLVIFRELKKQNGRVTPDQRAWLDALGLRHDVDVWRPSDLFSGRIDAELLALRQGQS